ncbi:MAG: porin family protein [Bacteroidetes bacterium]|nr:porin family protein [Bacteroidota bacterium]
MRKTIIILLFACALSNIYAQQRPYKFGIKGGINYIHLENYGKGFYSDFDAKPGWGVGALFQYTKGGFLNYSISPEILFTQSVTEVDLLYITDCLTTIQTIDVPLSFKLGLQLSKIFRPYILGNIYGSYIIKEYGNFFSLLDIDHSQPASRLNKLYFGVSAGFGFDLWKFELEGRYRWNLTKINTDDYAALKQYGLELSCAILF